MAAVKAMVVIAKYNVEGASGRPHLWFNSFSAP
jgi:hypothetical protein